MLTAVGLLPIAAAGIDIGELMRGAADSMDRFSVLSADNDAYRYAMRCEHEFFQAAWLAA